ncbi:tRNA pseudouridine(13) synthase TruD [Methanocaldococcus infernus]
MKVKLRVKPEDFIVEEVLDLNKVKGSKCYLYKLTKRNIECLKALSYISKKFKIPLKDIGYCGLKDRHALTIQYISIPKKYGKLSLNEKNLKLELVGESRFLKLGDLEGNKFKIVVRDLGEEHLKRFYENVSYIEKIPNYFDSQRFGSVFNKKFIVKEIIKGNYEEALKIILTQYKKSENKRIKNFKRFVNQHWGDWEKIWDYIKNKDIRAKLYVNIIKELRESNDFKKALTYIDDRLKKLFLAAYQSYLWNECVKEILKNKVDEPLYYNYECGTLLFFKELKEELEFKDFPTIALDSYYNEEERKIIDRVLKREGIRLEDLDRAKIFGKFVYTKRDILMEPKDFRYSVKEDEIYRGKRKVELEYFLKKGSYATMVIKRLFL